MTYECHILSCLQKAKGTVRLHMPGHKGDKSFGELFPGAYMDITELCYSDNLACPHGAIQRAQQDIAEILGSKRSYITTNGSTSGVYALIYAATRDKKKIVIPRQSHESVFNACAVLGVEPVVIDTKNIGGIYMPPTPKELELSLEDEDISAFLCTSPTYYGQIAPLKEYKRICKERGIYLLCDGAHGAHLILEEGLHCSHYADAWVDGAHKSLPTLTQGAVISLNNCSLQGAIEEGLSLFCTSSPSYPIMASVEYGIKYLINFPEKIRQAKKAAQKFRREILFPQVPDYGDWAKVCLDLNGCGICARELDSELQKRGIYSELCDGRHILFYLSPMTKKTDLDKTIQAIREILSQGLCAGESECLTENIRGKKIMPYLKAVSSPYEYVLIEGAKGRVLARNIGITPPCTPVCLAGEELSQDIIKTIKNAGGVFGLYGGAVKVVKNER